MASAGAQWLWALIWPAWHVGGAALVLFVCPEWLFCIYFLCFFCYFRCVVLCFLGVFVHLMCSLMEWPKYPPMVYLEQPWVQGGLGHYPGWHGAWGGGFGLCLKKCPLGGRSRRLGRVGVV